jgi:hypothetical protein
MLVPRRFGPGIKSLLLARRPIGKGVVALTKVASFIVTATVLLVTWSAHNLVSLVHTSTTGSTSIIPSQNSMPDAV